MAIPIIMAIPIYCGYSYLSQLFPFIMAIPSQHGYSHLTWLFPFITAIPIIMAIPIYCGYSYLSWLFSYIMAIPIYHGYSHLTWLFSFIMAIQMHHSYSHLTRLLFIPIVPIYYGYSHFAWLFPCIISVPIYHGYPIYIIFIGFKQDAGDRNIQRSIVFPTTFHLQVTLRARLQTYKKPVNQLYPNQERQRRSQSNSGRRINDSKLLLKTAPETWENRTSNSKNRQPFLIKYV